VTIRRPRSPRGSGEQLRAEIVAAARELMADAPSASSVSIRAVADAVGVTPPSIYRHFADKDDLITAVCVDVFDGLDRAMIAAGEGVDHPLQRLRAYGHAYVRFAVDHPGHYRLASMEPGHRPDLDEVLAQSAFTHMSSVVEELVAAGTFAPGETLDIALDLWAAAHGIASLMIVKPYLPWGDVTAAVDRVLLASALGHATTPEALGWPDFGPPPALG